MCFSSQCKDFFKVGKGVYDDLHRRLPLYLSDFTDGINCFAMSCGCVTATT